jgi:hypothetical protein
MLIKVYFHFMTAGAFIVSTYDTVDHDSTRFGTQGRAAQNIIKVCIHVGRYT